MKKLTIIHFMPLEYYPPVINFIRFIDSKSAIQTCVLSCNNTQKQKVFETEKSRIIRFPFVKDSMSSLRKLIYYAWFNIGAFFRMIFQNPEIILYYESYSAMPVYWYLKFVKSSARLFIHHHEYFEPDWYPRAMRSVALNHRLEVNYLYCRAEWISHTNHFRLELFKKDYKLDSKILNISSNYPPMNWKSHPISKSNDNQIKLVLIGHTLNFDTMYGKEIIDWVKSQNGKVTLDCYLFVPNIEVEKYCVFINCRYVNFKPSVEYFSLPKLLNKYDVGLILYKAKSLNFRFNAPNKLFEYLACGLDVWFPNVMEGSKAYVCMNARPRVIDVDFNKLEHYKYSELFGESNLPIREINYTCETEYEKIYKAIIREE